MSNKSRNASGAPDGAVRAGDGFDAELETPVRSRTLRSQVVSILKHAIFYGKLHPEELLPELALAKKLRVSQSTVREALAELERYGLVVRIHNRGTVVASLGSTDIQNRMKVRLVLEEMALPRHVSFYKKTISSTWTVWHAPSILWRRPASA